MISYDVASAINVVAMLFPTFLCIFTVRGWARALAAYKSGDPTPYHEGFVTLNPLVHINVIGMSLFIVLLIVLSLLFQGLPGRTLLIALMIAGVRMSVPVPVDESLFRHHSRGIIATTLAGPCALLALGAAAIAVTIYFPAAHVPQYISVTVAQMMALLSQMAIFFFVLDMLPLPPFDGARLLPYILPRRWHGVIDWLEEYALYIFLVLFLMPGVSDLFLLGLSSIVVFIKVFFVIVLGGLWR